jgi:hypothetical protein
VGLVYDPRELSGVTTAGPGWLQLYSCEPHGVHAHCFLVILIHGDVEGGGGDFDSLSDGVPPPNLRH